MPCSNPMYAVRMGDKFKFVGAVQSDPTMSKAKYMFSSEEKFIILPCGQCVGCRLERSRSWAIRCSLEKQLHKDSCFLTLTYDDEHLPRDYSLHKEHLTNFFKRLRFNESIKFRYFACGEYGDLYSRPHYHVILFGYRPDDLVPVGQSMGNILYTSPKILKAWQNQGYVSLGEVTFESCAYTARYIMKKITGDKAEEYYHGREPEYVVMSRRPGIAHDWLLKYDGDVYPNDYVVVRGDIKTKPPRYFDNLYAQLYGEGALEEIKSERFGEQVKSFNRNLDEFTLSRMVTKGRIKEIKNLLLKRSLDERL